MDFEQWNLDHDQMKQIANSLSGSRTVWRRSLPVWMAGKAQDSSPLAVKWIFADE